MDCEVHLVTLDIGVQKEETPSQALYETMDEFDHSSGVSSVKDWDFDIVRPQIGCVSLISKVDTLSPNLGKSEDFTQPEPYTEELDGLFSPLETSLSQDDGSLDNIGEGKGTPGICGLKNLGNTCFMGAGVQCLVATAPLIHCLLTTPHHLPNSLTLDLTELSRKMWSGCCNTLHPGKFKSAIANHFPHFNDFRQHDCQEFLAMLLDRLHEEMNSARNKDVGCQIELQENSFNDDSKVPSTSSKSVSLLGYQNCNKMGNSGFNNLDAYDIPMEGCKDSMSISTNTEMELEIENESSCESSNPVDRCDYDCDKIILNNVNSGMMCAKKEDVSLLNNSVSRFGGLEDIVKDAKTSNVNVLVMEQEANNEIRYDSEKFPKVETSRRRVGSFNVNSFHLYENNMSAKRCKSTVTHFTSPADFKEGLDLKRVKLNCEEQLAEKNQKMEMERKNKTSGSKLIEKNHRMESERKGRVKAVNEGIENSDQSIDAVPSSSSESLLPEYKADQHWEKHLAANRSVIVETFQGQFKSTVVCSICQYVSVTYEPFMYLSVPLPNALQKQLTVTFVGESCRDGMKLVIELNKYDTLGLVKEQILGLIDFEVQEPVIIGEVLNHHISKLLDDNFLVRHLNETDRSLYAFEALSILGKEFGTSEAKGEDTMEERCCTICLEEKENNMKRHIGCTCIVCDVCITTSCQHYSGTSLECPICRKEVFPEIDFVRLKPNNRVAVRMIYVPLMFRVDTSGDGNNNQKVVKLFGQPMLLWLPSKCSGDELHSAVNALINNHHPFKLLLVDGQGLHCSRCLFYTHCKGCPVAVSETVSFRSSDSLAACFSDITVDYVPPAVHPSVNIHQPHLPLTLNDCVQAFSQSETLDANNPWFCPKCRRNQCATKTLTVCRYPDYLIVYLKRFVFHNNVSTKLEEKVSFPLVGLELPFCDSPFDLYACVCHVGGVSAGHYTSYTQHPYSGEWHYFNDCCVTSQAPQEEDYSNAYILFYRKRGVEIPQLDLDGSSVECI